LEMERKISKAMAGGGILWHEKVEEH